jgi:hypothetical protein
MAFSREDIPPRAAAARREVLLSLQPQIDGVSKKPWNRNVLVFNPKEPFNPQSMHVSEANMRDPDFRRDFYEASPFWDSMSTIDPKLERRQYKAFTAVSREGTLRACARLESAPLLVTRQIRYAKKIKAEGIPAAQPPPPFVVKHPRMAKLSHKKIHRFDLTKPYHDGEYGESPALGGHAWSCCGNADQNCVGCRRLFSNIKLTLYD